MCLKGVCELVNEPITKRVILSLSQMVFNPIGFTASSTLLPKFCLQKTWEEKLPWDSPVDSEIETELEELHFYLKPR